MSVDTYLGEASGAIMTVHHVAKYLHWADLAVQQGDH
jgi:hypothetical protein